jgi:hypothetical protein
MIFLSLIISTLTVMDCLAPHPLYFTIDGKPTTINVNVEKGQYDVKWDGQYLSIYQTNRGHDGADHIPAWIQKPPEEPPVNPNTFLSGCGCYTLFFGAAIWFWGSLWLLFFGYWQISLLSFLGVILLGVIMSIFLEIKKRWK